MLEFSARVAARDFDVTLTVESGETLAVLGPNGSGKSTLLDTIAGLVRPDTGFACLDDTVLFDFRGSSGAGWLPPHKRSVSLLAQNPLLFPRMSVHGNVEFGPRAAGAGKKESRARATHWLTEVDAIELATRKPSQLSGGQAGRVAIARALAAEPRLLLLDEPMAALDVTVVPALRGLLRRVLATRTTIMVTHDVLDAYTLADRVAVISEGRLVELGTTRDVFERPHNSFTAALVGMNLITGVRTRSGLRTDGGLDLATAATEIPEGAAVGGTIAPAAISISMFAPARAPQIPRGVNAIEARVVDLEPRGGVVRVNTGIALVDVAPIVVADLDLVPGANVWISFDESELRLYEL